MRSDALNAMIAAWGEGLILSCRTEGKIHLTYSKQFPPSAVVLAALRIHQPTIVRALPKEIVT